MLRQSRNQRFKRVFSGDAQVATKTARTADVRNFKRSKK